MRNAVAVRPTRVEIDLDALRHNARLLRRIAGVPLFAVVKADAYGHGANEVGRTLAAASAADGFAVSLVEEGIHLRQAGVVEPILVMGPALAGGYEEIVARKLTAVISDPADLEGLARAGARLGVRPSAHVKIDTGMGRLGVLPGSFQPLLKRLPDVPAVEITGFSTHFACADSDRPDDPRCMTHAQIRAFDASVEAAARAGLSGRTLHLANSSATIKFPESRRDLVRCGLALYGNGEQPAPGEAGDMRLRQVMRLRTDIAQVRSIPAGHSVSYGALWRARRASRLAVLPIGYADGLPRRVTGRAEVLLRGRRFPVVGAVSMDITVVDITDLGDSAAVGEEVVILGGQGGERITAAEFADWVGFSQYEVTCGVSKRVPRVFVDNSSNE